VLDTQTALGSEEKERGDDDDDDDDKELIEFDN
jgi:hypothetical protein